MDPGAPITVPETTPAEHASALSNPASRRRLSEYLTSGILSFVLRAWKGYLAILTAVVGISITAVVPDARVRIAALAFLAIVAVAAVLGTR